MNYLYNVATKKGVLVTIRIAENVRDEFKMAAELRGSTMSGLMHQFIIRTIREEKQMSPQAFVTQGVRSAEVTLAPVVATITPAVDPKDEIRRTMNEQVATLAAAKKVELRIGNAKPREFKPKMLKRWQSLLDATQLSPTADR